MIFWDLVKRKFIGNQQDKNDDAVPVSHDKEYYALICKKYECIKTLVEDKPL